MNFYMRLAGVCAIALSGLMSAPAYALATVSPLELIGGNATRTILLSVHPAPASGDGTLVGTVMLTVRNDTQQSQSVSIVLADSLPGPTPLAHVTFPPEALRQVPVTVTLPPGTEPDALEGTILVQARSGKAKHAHPALSVPVTASIAPVGDVRFAPNPTVVQVTRWCLLVFPCNTTSGGTVELSGSGVASLLAALQAAGNPALATKLRSGSNTLDAELTDLKANPLRPGTASAHLVLGAKPPPGAFTGAIPLSSLLPQAPTLAIKVHSRYMFAWAALAILLGVLAAGYLYQQLGLARRKRILREMMESTINGEYCVRREENAVHGAGGKTTLVWDPQIDCPLKDNRDWTYYTELTTPSNIYTALYWARNDADLNEAQTAALTVVRTVKTWLLALTDVRDLWELAEAPREKQDQWNDTMAAWDTRLLLSKARHVPSDPAACSTLLAKVQQQTAWHRALAEVWDVRAKLVDLGGEAGEAAMHVDLSGLAAEAKPVLTRNEDEQDELELKLERMRGDLLKLVAKANADPHMANVEVTPLPAFERETVSGRLRGEIAALSSPGRVDFARMQAMSAIAPGHGDEGTEQAAAAPGGGHRAGNGAGQAVAEANGAPRGRPPTPPTANRRSRITRRFQLLDLMLSFAILLIISLLYAAGIYGPSWGSISDWASAFGAGFLGQVTVKWALLPIYQSLRPRDPANAQDAGAAASSAGG